MTKKNRPNIILIMTDQQRFDTISALGYSYMDTPNLDRLVQKGVAFTNCFVTAPTCVPSRASFFKGYYSNTTGIYKNEDLWQHSWIEDLQKSGYYTVNIGKMHTTPPETPIGFDERFVVENKDRYLERRFYNDRWDMHLYSRGYKKPQRELYRQREDYYQSLGAFDWELPEDCHSDVFVGNLTKWWLDTQPKKEPLFMMIGFPGPHPPFDPPPRYAEPYLKKELPLPSVTKEELEKQPEPLRRIHEHTCEVDHDSVYWRDDPTQEQLHRMRAYYYANVTMIDELIGDIMDSLANNGYLDDTIILFTSDHGDCMGDHGHIEKWNMFDVTIRVPMIVWGPKYFTGGRKYDSLCQHFDAAPVIMEMAGLSIPSSWQTESLMPALKGEPFPGREYVYCLQGDDPRFEGITEQITMIRSKTWKLVHYLGNEDEGELYNLEQDPEERDNLFWNPQYREKRDELTARLMAWVMRSDIKTNTWSSSWR